MYTYTCILVIYMYINYLKYSSNLQILKESQNTSDCDLEVYINHSDKLRENFKILSGDLDSMHVLNGLLFHMI